MKSAAIETYALSKTFDAPMEFVFDWCTDFREDDGEMTGEKSERKFLERTPERIVWVGKHRDKHGEVKEGVRVVWLKRPTQWHLDTCGDGREVGHYKLTSLGPNKTRLDMTFDVTYDEASEVEPKEKWEGDARKEWEVFGTYLEREFKRST